MVQQKKELSLAEVGRTSNPLPWSRALCSHWLEHRTQPTDSNSLWVCPKECGQGGRSCLRMARMAVPPCGLLNLGQH